MQVWRLMLGNLFSCLFPVAKAALNKWAVTVRMHSSPAPRALVVPGQTELVLTGCCCFPQPPLPPSPGRTGAELLTLVGIYSVVGGIVLFSLLFSSSVMLVYLFRPINIACKKFQYSFLLFVTCQLLNQVPIRQPWGRNLFNKQLFFFQMYFSTHPRNSIYAPSTNNLYIYVIIIIITIFLSYETLSLQCWVSSLFPECQK